MYRLSKDHVLTKIELCVNRNDWLHGVELTYGVHKYWGVSEVKTFHSHGTYDYHGGSIGCKSLDISDGDYVTSMRIYYNEKLGVAGLLFVTNNGNTIAEGLTITNYQFEGADGNTYTIRRKEFLYGYSKRFYGFSGEEHPRYYEDVSEWLSNSLASLAVIEYNKFCVDYYQTMLGSGFSWTRDSWVCYSGCSTSSTSTTGGGDTSYTTNYNTNGGGYDNYDEESCYAFGTTVTRRTSEGKNETVPIEVVKEGDFILAKGTQGLFFTEAISNLTHSVVTDEK